MRVDNSDELKDVGDIGNYYGGIQVTERHGKYWWGIENWDGTFLTEIPKYLFDALIKFDKELKDSEISKEQDNREGL